MPLMLFLQKGFFVFLLIQVYTPLLMLKIYLIFRYKRHNEQKPETFRREARLMLRCMLFMS